MTDTFLAICQSLFQIEIIVIQHSVGRLCITTHDGV